MEAYAIPVINGMLPRAEGGTLQGVFIDQFAVQGLQSMGIGGEVFVCPFSFEDGRLYPVGVLAAIAAMWPQEVMLPQLKAKRTALFVRLTGQVRAKAENFFTADNLIVGSGIRSLDLEELRSQGYATICGAGWTPQGGYTEARSVREIEITVYGIDTEDGTGVTIRADVGGSVTPEQAHTIEHAIIRSLRAYGICTAKTLRQMIGRETDELKESVAAGLKFRMPEIFGVTAAGVCGNPMTNLARFYLTQETVRLYKSGKNLRDSLSGARNKTLSRLTGDLDISTRAGLRVLQGLKRGMRHDDTLPAEGTLRRVLERFPPHPWK